MSSSTHAGCRALFDTGRNKGDAEIRAVAEKGGVFGVFNMTNWLTDAPRPTVDHVVDHVAHAVKLAGVEHVSFGSDGPVLARAGVNIEQARMDMQAPEIARLINQGAVTCGGTGLHGLLIGLGAALAVAGLPASASAAPTALLAALLATGTAYFYWLGAAVIALVTLRRGLRQGALILVWALLPALAQILWLGDTMPLASIISVTLGVATLIVVNSVMAITAITT